MNILNKGMDFQPNNSRFVQLILTIIIVMLFSAGAKAQWSQIGLDIDGAAANDKFGSSVCLSGDGLTMASVAIMDNLDGPNTGKVQIMKLIDNQWNQVGEDIIGEVPNVNFGYSLDINEDGSIVAVGAPKMNGGGDERGEVQVYKYVDSNWEQMGQNLEGQIDHSEFGISLSLNAAGSRLAVGATGPDDDKEGNVFIFEINDETWEQIGPMIKGEVEDDHAKIVSLNHDGNIIAVGAPGNDGNGSNAGQVRVYNYNGSTWIQRGEDIDGESEFDISGHAVSINADGSILVVGAPHNNGVGTRAGQTRVFQYDGADWIQMGQDIDGQEAFDISGSSVDISPQGNSVVIGSITNGSVDDGVGHARIFRYTGVAWIQLGNDIVGESPGDLSGGAVAMGAEGSMVAIGAEYNDEMAENAGHVRVFKFGTVNSVDEPIFGANITLFPNPTIDRLTIDLGDVAATQIEVVNQIGQIVIPSINVNAKRQEISTRNLDQGIYLVKITNGDLSRVIKIVKQ